MPLHQLGSQKLVNLVHNIDDCKHTVCKVISFFSTIFSTYQSVLKTNSDKNQNLGFLFLPVYFVSAVMTFPLLLSLSFLFATIYFLFNIFLPPFFRILFLSFRLILTSPSTSYSISSSSYVFPFI